MMDVMSSVDDALARLAVAAERIADALEALLAREDAARPRPRLTVARSPTDTSRSAPAVLKADGMLMVLVQNVGERDTTLSAPEVELGGVRQTGEIIDRDNRPRPSARLPAAKQGPGVTVVFGLERGAQTLLRDERMVLRLPHAPGRLPGTTVLEVELEFDAVPGPADATLGWRPIASRERSAPHGAAT